MYLQTFPLYSPQKYLQIYLILIHFQLILLPRPLGILPTAPQIHFLISRISLDVFPTHPPTAFFFFEEWISLFLDPALLSREALLHPSQTLSPTEWPSLTDFPFSLILSIYELSLQDLL